MKYQVKSTVPTTYQLQSVRLFGSPIKSNMDGSHTFRSELFDTEQEAKDYLIKRAEMYFENDDELQEAISDINQYGSLSMDAASGGIYEVEEEETED